MHLIANDALRNEVLIKSEAVLLLKHHAMKTYWGEEVCNLRSRWSASHCPVPTGHEANNSSINKFCRLRPQLV
jgi:hypothetical protein